MHTTVCKLHAQPHAVHVVLREVRVHDDIVNIAPSLAMCMSVVDIGNQRGAGTVLTYLHHDACLRSSHALG